MMLLTAYISNFFLIYFKNCYLLLKKSVLESKGKKVKSNLNMINYEAVIFIQIFTLMG